ncbi:MAG: hypothetical protein Q4F05_15870 [bacterium]|nr:hypothetical protein [bacterium]
MDELKKSEDGRIITVSSASHAQGGRPYLDDIELKEHYSYMKVYGTSKLYVIWAMRHLKKELEAKGIKNITVNCTHPGSAKTHLGESDQRPFLMKLLFAAWIPLMTSVEKGSESTIYAATSNEIKGQSNLYIGPKGLEKVKDKYYSEQNEKILWDYCMKVVGPYLEKQ